LEETKMPGIPTVEQMHAKFLREGLQTRAQRLRDLAATFDGLAAQVDTSTSYTTLAADAVHGLAWTTANLTMERLVTEAASADVAKANGK
jgi:hypothetical protein